MHDALACPRVRSLVPSRSVLASRRITVPRVPHHGRPVVDRCFPAQSPALGGITTTVYGRNFGTEDTNPTAWVGGVRCQPTVWLSDSTMECGVPQGFGANQPIEVEVGGQRSDPKELLTYEPPEVDAIYPPHAPGRGGDNVTVAGRNFGHKNHQPRVTIGGEACPQVWWLSDSAIVCQVPKACKAKNCRTQQLPVKVLVGDRWSDGDVLFSYDGPVVKQLIPTAFDTKGSQPDGDAPPVRDAANPDRGDARCARG